MTDDLISRQDLIEHLTEWVSEQTVSKYISSAECKAIRSGAILMLEMVDKAPAVDATVVVRCGDCIHDGMSECPLCYIENHTMRFINHDGNWYCSCGERKDGEV